jgi:Glycosyl hydrolase family 79 C-terminal beta domain
LSNIGAIQGSNPIVRVGGNTQDYATFDPAQTQGLIGTYNYTITKDYPTKVTIGPNFFQSYDTWFGNISFIHGFNFNSTNANTYINQEMPYICQHLYGGNKNKLAYFQLGNEPNLYKHYTEASYVSTWKSKTELMHTAVQQNCPDLISDTKFRFYSPSLSGALTTGSIKLNLTTIWLDGLNNDSYVGFIDSHNYIGGAKDPGISLQKTLMNHTNTAISVGRHLTEIASLKPYTSIPYILGEANSLYNEGTPGLSDSFGAALWNVDFGLYCAATGIQRVHMHQGLDYRYAAWQPRTTANATIGTKPPYYGNIMVARMLGNLTAGQVRIANLPQSNETISAYAAYLGSTLQRIAVIQMREYNYTHGTRGNETFQFQFPLTHGVKRITVERLMANGSDAITGISYNGTSYNYDLSKGSGNVGKPYQLANMTRGTPELLTILSNGTLFVPVPWSSAAILNFFYT